MYLNYYINRILVWKLITLVVIVTFSVTSTAYGMDLSNKRTHLRNPLLFSENVSKQDRERPRDGKETADTAFADKELNIQDSSFLKKVFRLIFGWYPLLPEQSKIAADVIRVYQDAFKIDIIKKGKRIEGYVSSKIFRQPPGSFSLPAVFIVSLSLFSGINTVKMGIINHNGGLLYTGSIMILFSALLAIAYFSNIFVARTGRILGIIILKGNALNLIDMRFIAIIAHELSHLCKLPNHRLLADAYTIGILGRARFEKLIGQIENIGETEKLSENMGNLSSGVEEFDSDVKYLILADVSIELIPDSVKREVVIRKILSQSDYLAKFEKCNTKQDIKELLTVVSNGLIDKDYNIPRIYAELLQSWCYLYGRAMGYIAIKTYSDKYKALQYIYRLGQTHSSHELEGFEPEGVPTIDEQSDDTGERKATATKRAEESLSKIETDSNRPGDAMKAVLSSLHQPLPAADDKVLSVKVWDSENSKEEYPVSWLPSIESMLALAEKEGIAVAYNVSVVGNPFLTKFMDMCSTAGSSWSQYSAILQLSAGGVSLKEEQLRDLADKLNISFEELRGRLEMPQWANSLIITTERASPEYSQQRILMEELFHAMEGNHISYEWWRGNENWRGYRDDENIQLLERIVEAVNAFLQLMFYRRNDQVKFKSPYFNWTDEDRAYLVYTFRYRYGLNPNIGPKCRNIIELLLKDVEWEIVHSSPKIILLFTGLKEHDTQIYRVQHLLAGYLKALLETEHFSRHSILFSGWEMGVGTELAIEAIDVPTAAEIKGNVSQFGRWFKTICTSL